MRKRNLHAKTIFIVLICSCLTFTTMAQSKTGISVYLGGIQPVGSFFSTDNSAYWYDQLVAGTPTYYNGASIGALIGLRYTYSFQKTKLADKGLGIFINADLYWNTLNSDFRNEYDDAGKQKPCYLNVPINMGINYTYYLGDDDFVGIFAEASAGIDLFKRTNEGWTDNSAYEITKYDLTTSFGCSAGLGVILGKTISLGIYYNYLGKHQMILHGGKNIILPMIAIEPYTMTMNTVSLKIGFHF